ncbi:MAG: hypothetical protein VKL59_21370 [Nostocaceae cyanobacterium]|nr:hypothetical protein [Nostocaceae cyanobacterium]
MKLKTTLRIGKGLILAIAVQLSKQFNFSYIPYLIGVVARSRVRSHS